MMMENKKDMVSGVKEFIPKIAKKYRSLSKLDKRILWIILGTILIIILLNLTIETIRNLNSDLSYNECNFKITEAISYSLSLQEENKYLAFLYTYKKLIGFMLVVIAIAWIIHGVGFHVIKR